AGNEAQQHWSGTFLPDPANPSLELFASSDDGNTVSIANGETACAYLKWDAWPVTSQDYDLALIRSSTGAVVASSTNEQAGGPVAPTEQLCYTNTGPTQNFALVISRYSATASPRFDLFYTGSSQLEYQTAAGSLLEPATSPSALAVGAVCWQTSSLEPYS